MRSVHALYLALSLLLLPTSVPAQQQGAPGKSLYERLGEIGEERLNGQPLGGAYKIAAIVSDLIDRLQVNEIIRANTKISQISAPAMPGHKFEFTLLVCSLAGGPQQYAGRSLTEAHKGLEVSRKEWDAMMAELRVVLNEHRVSAADQEEFVHIIEGTSADVITYR